MKTVAGFVMGSVLLAPSAAVADEQETEFGLLGDFSGERARWSNRGLHPFLNYTADGLALLRGGFQRDESLQGAAEFGMECDLEKTAGWPDARLHLHGLYFHGDDPSADFVGDANYLSNIVAPSGVRLFEAWVGFTRGSWEFKAGLLATDTDFGGCEPANLFVNSSFGPLPSYAYNSSTPVWPFSGPGVAALGKLGETGFLRLGLYDGAVEDSHENRHGLRHEVSSSEGVFGVAELGSTWNSDGRSGSWTVGAWWHSGKFTDFRDDSEVDGNAGFHLMLQEAITPDGRWMAFGRIGYAPKDDRTFISLHTDLGVVGQGVFRGRPRDSLGLAYFRSRYGNDYLAGRRSAGDSVTTAEAGIELTYSCSLGRGVWLQPDLQYIFDPHESGSDAAVAIVRLYVEF